MLLSEMNRIQRVTSIYKALANSTRLRILSLIAESEDICAKDIGGKLGLSQPDISYHLSRLHKVDVLDREKRGTRYCYSVNNETLEYAAIKVKVLISLGN